MESAYGAVVKKRMEGEGERWNVEGAEAILLLRSLEKSGDYPAYRRFHTMQERKRVYENKRNDAPLIP